MDMIEVDPKLFVTCRLCLEDMGQYQIVPILQQQIKYCFDIDVSMVFWFRCLFLILPQFIAYTDWQSWLLAVCKNKISFT